MAEENRLKILKTLKKIIRYAISFAIMFAVLLAYYTSIFAAYNYHQIYLTIHPMMQYSATEPVLRKIVKIATVVSLMAPFILSLIMYMPTIKNRLRGDH